jgi:AcrR family transcriptional regulator
MATRTATTATPPAAPTVPPTGAPGTPPGTPHGTPRQRYARGEGDRLRQDLLESAADLMAKHGDIDSISLRAVARDAGVSATAVYRHFDDHLDLLRQSVEYCWGHFRSTLGDAAARDDDPFVRFRAMGDAYVQFALEHPGQYRVLFSNKIDLGDEGGPVGISAFHLLVDNVADMLRVLDDDRDPFFVAVQVHTWMHGIVDLVGCHPAMAWPPIERLMDGLSNALGLVEPDSDSGSAGTRDG